GAPWKMQRRSDAGIRVKSLALSTADSPESAAQLGPAAASEVLILAGPSITGAVGALADTLSREAATTTRIAIGFGAAQVTPEFLHSALARIPCLSVGGAALRNDALIAGLAEAFPISARSQAAPCLLAAFRAEWLAHAQRTNDAAGYVDGLL